MKGIDIDKATDLVKKVIRFGEKYYLFDKDLAFPDAIIPETIKPASREHALFLFYSISIDSMSQAQYVYKFMRKLSKNLKGDLERIADLNKDELCGRLEINKSKKDMINSVATLIENSQKIREYENDPRKLRGKNVEETLENITQFKQYGKPKAALLIKNFVRFGIWDFLKHEIPVKVDRHICRISLGYEVINTREYEEFLDPTKNHSKQLIGAVNQLVGMGLLNRNDFEQGKIKLIKSKDIIDPLTKVYLDVTKKEKISAIRLDDALWYIGSKFCKKNSYDTCMLACPIKCNIRYPSDNHANWFFIDVDKRKNLRQIFFDLE